jgi:hypothetical protein
LNIVGEMSLSFHVPGFRAIEDCNRSLMIVDTLISSTIQPVCKNKMEGVESQSVSKAVLSDLTIQLENCNVVDSPNENIAGEPTTSAQKYLPSLDNVASSPESSDRYAVQVLPIRPRQSQRKMQSQPLLPVRVFTFTPLCIKLILLQVVKGDEQVEVDYHTNFCPFIQTSDELAESSSQRRAQNTEEELVDLTLQDLLGCGNYSYGTHFALVDVKEMIMRRGEVPFSQGAMRFACHAQLLSKGQYEEPKPKGVSGVGRKQFTFVAKTVKAILPRSLSPTYDYDDYATSMMEATIAIHLAGKYNESPYRPAHCGCISFLPVAVVQVVDEQHNPFRGRFPWNPFREGLCVEKELPEDLIFENYCNNDGWWGEPYDETLVRFVKYTHQVTHGFCMVTDLQGVQNGNEFILTDPVILTTMIGGLSSTDGGRDFMDRCLVKVNELMKVNGWEDVRIE